MKNSSTIFEFVDLYNLFNILFQTLDFSLDGIITFPYRIDLLLISIRLLYQNIVRSLFTITSNTLNHTISIQIILERVDTTIFMILLFLYLIYSHIQFLYFGLILFWIILEHFIILLNYLFQFLILISLLYVVGIKWLNLLINEIIMVRLLVVI